jgi:serine/threonine protein kinase
VQKSPQGTPLQHFEDGRFYACKASFGSRTVDLRTFKFQLKLGSEEHKQFQHDLQIMYALEHPNIRSFYGGWMIADPAPAIVVEYFSFDLRTVLRFSDRFPTLTQLRKATIVMEIAHALSFCHSRPVRIDHTDVRPENIMLTADYTAKLANFALNESLFVPEETESGRIAYMVCRQE